MAIDLENLDFQIFLLNIAMEYYEYYEELSETTDLGDFQDWLIEIDGVFSILFKNDFDE